MFKLGVLLFLLTTASLVVGDRLYIIINSCPTDSTLLINGASQGTIKGSGGTFQQSLSDYWDGFIYLDTNGGNANGTGTTRAGFYGDNGYYYIVKDPNYSNVGVTITPINQTPSNGFCVPATCSSLSCTTAFSQPPTGFPAPSATAPSPPNFACPQPATGYIVEFCPNQKFPLATTVSIHPSNSTSKCLDVRAAVYANGTPVQIYDCNGTGAQKWQVQYGSTSLRVAGTNFCLDAGSTPENGVGMKIWTCYDNLAAQSWYYASNNQIALTNKGQCLDLTGGILTNSNQVQTWQCASGNNNQLWTTS